MHASCCAFTIVEYIRTSKSCTLFNSSSTFCAEAEERGYVSFSLSAYFSMTQYSREKSSMKYPLSSTEDYSDQCYKST